MKPFKIGVILAVFLGYAHPGFSQDTLAIKDYIHLKYTLDKNSTKVVKKENVDLQSFVESLYINASKLYNQALPSVKSGAYLVVTKQNDGKGIKLIRTEQLKDISLNAIKTLTYKKLPRYAKLSAIYGSFFARFGSLFGIVIITFKK